MDYYYNDGRETWGPIPEEALRALARAGIVGKHTEIWRDGLDDWRELGQLLPDLLASAVEAPGSRLTTSTDEALTFVTCSQCRQTRLEEDVEQIRGEPVCSVCRLLFVERMGRRLFALTSPEGPSPEQPRLLELACAHKRMLICALAITLTLLCTVAAFLEEPANWFIVLFAILWPNLAVVGGITIYMLAEALRYPYSILWLGAGLLLCACGVGLVLMLFLHHQATRQLRGAGFNVGFSGANLLGIHARSQASGY
jgi:hypothetical protein